MTEKEIRIRVTEKQREAIRKKAQYSNQNMSEFVRSILIEHGVIEYEPIEHGGYRPRKGRKVKK